MPNIRPLKARTFCSVALVKWTLSLSWPDAAAALDLPVEPTTKLTYDVVRRLEATGTSAAVAERINALSVELNATRTRIDFRRRRTALRDMSELDPVALATSWAPAQPPRLSHARRRALAAWLWAELTGSDPRHAPAWRGRWGATERVCYRRLLASDIVDLPAFGARYGASVLSTQ
jgi:hypothetical protein